MTFGQKLKYLRTEKNLTQTQLANLLKLSKANISKYESDSVEPNLETLTMISKIFDVSLDYLLSMDSTKKSDPLTDEQGSQIIQRALKDTGLTEPDGSLTKRGGKVISDFISSNAEILKKLINDDK